PMTLAGTRWLASTSSIWSAWYSKKRSISTVAAILSSCKSVRSYVHTIVAVKRRNPIFPQGPLALADKMVFFGDKNRISEQVFAQNCSILYRTYVLLSSEENRKVAHF